MDLDKITEQKGLKYERQKSIPLTYKGRAIGEFRIDLVVENVVVLELLKDSIKRLIL